MSQFTYLRGVITRMLVARINLKKAHDTGNHQENQIAGQEWLAAYTAYVNWYN